MDKSKEEEECIRKKEEEEKKKEEEVWNRNKEEKEREKISDVCVDKKIEEEILVHRERRMIERECNNVNSKRKDKRDEEEEEKKERETNKKQEHKNQNITKLNTTETKTPNSAPVPHLNERQSDHTPATTHLSSTYHISANTPNTCACGGMPQTAWRERLLSLRENDLLLREREIAVREREREANIRERKIAGMEREAREHLVRAQIFLRQARPRLHATSDLDTTVSPDLDETQEVTTARPDPKVLHNPFLEMRGGQVGSGSACQGKRVLFRDGLNTQPFKSNTLDNPKSRKKTGCVFTLARTSKDDPKDSIQGLRDIQGHSNIPVGCREGQHEANITRAEVECQEKRIEMTSKGVSANTKDKKGHRNDEIRSDKVISHPHLPSSAGKVKRLGTGMTRDKENQVPLKGKGQRVPDLKKPLVTRKNKEVRSENSRVLQFYNVV